MKFTLFIKTVKAAKTANAFSGFEYHLHIILYEQSGKRDIDIFTSYHYPTVRRVKNMLDTVLVDLLGYKRTTYNAKQHKTEYSTRV